MKILITGVAGYIGGTFAYEMLKKGFQIHGLDNFSNSSDKYIRIFKKKFPHNFKFKKIDLSKEKKLLQEIVNDFDPSATFHFAGLKAVLESQNNPEHYKKNNIKSTLNLLESLKPYSSLVFSSSATVYGRNNPLPLTEKSTLSASSVYGETKIISEELITDYSIRKGLKSICLRYFNPVGCHKDFIVKEDFNENPSNLMPRLIQTVKNNENVISIYGKDYKTEDGTAERDYIHIIDLIDGHFKALERLKNIKKTEFYNLGTGKPISVKKLVNTFNSVNNLNVLKKYVGRRDGDVEISFSDPSAAFEKLNWKARYNLKQMCKDSWDSANE